MLNIVGAGGFAREVMLHWLAANNWPNRNREVTDPYLINMYVSPEHVLAAIDDLESVVKPEKLAFVIKALDGSLKVGNALIAVGDPRLKAKLGLSVLNLNSFLSDRAYYPLPENGSLDAGQIICPGASITTNVMLCQQVTVNLNATIGHDVNIGPYTTINPGANISGNVNIGAYCLIGAGAFVKEGVLIADGVTVGAGAVVTKDILEEDSVWVGCPARRIK